MDKRQAVFLAVSALVEVIGSLLRPVMSNPHTCSIFEEGEDCREEGKAESMPMVAMAQMVMKLKR